MAPSLFTLGTAALAMVGDAAAKQFVLDDTYDSTNFFDKFDFFESKYNTGDYNDVDLTSGYINYRTRVDAQKLGLISNAGGEVYVGPDAHNITEFPGVGRSSVRLESKAIYNKNLMVARFSHLPKPVCGAWPAFWSYGSPWPKKGELDFFEGWNNAAANKPAAHTYLTSEQGQCIISETGQTAKVNTANCDQQAPGQYTNEGCTTTATSADPWGSSDGGIYAVEWTDDYIKFFAWTHSAAPKNIGSDSPDTSSWGTPSMLIANDKCNINSHFADQRLVLNIDFCGVLAGNEYIWKDQCAASTGHAVCSSYVAANPGAYKDTYFKIKDIRVFKEGSKAVTTSSSASSTSTSTSISTSTSTSATTSSASTSSASTSSASTSSALTSTTISTSASVSASASTSTSASISASASGSVTAKDTSVSTSDSKTASGSASASGTASGTIYGSGSTAVSASASASGTSSKSTSASITPTGPITTSATGTKSATASVFGSISIKSNSMTEEDVCTESDAITTKTGVTSKQTQAASTTTPPVELTTSTVYTTKVSTITACPPSVTDCPARLGKVTTQTIALYTTVCPISSVPAPKPTKPVKGNDKPNDKANPGPGPAPGVSTTTFTTVYTITKCPPSVTNCPVGSVTTKVVTTSIPSAGTSVPIVTKVVPTVPSDTNSSPGVTKTLSSVSPSGVPLKPSASGGNSYGSGSGNGTVPKPPPGFNATIPATKPTTLTASKPSGTAPGASTTGCSGASCPTKPAVVNAAVRAGASFLLMAIVALAALAL
ncbi:beta-1,3-endoglucanase [Colletotrichum salicis]|uniref:Beta-1,3-endoglucanase n=1 Tax=Colletotrichum salicis TaxID=1209931 RepID=A0A135U218_9PEZI|nr:beta-1,3-endoglucanase [Colletotrichum salicis]